MEYSKKLQIFVCTHKPLPYTRNGGVFRALQCGAAINSEIDPQYLRDDVGDNISERNPYWSEWSGIYWIWKNVKHVEYIGINHYRRYFDFDKTEDNIEFLLDASFCNFSKRKVLTGVFKNITLHPLPDTVSGTLLFLKEVSLVGAFS